MAEPSDMHIARPDPRSGLDEAGNFTPRFAGQREPFPILHGAHSEPRIRAKARAHRRRFLRQAGLRAGDLDAVAVAKLDLWARGQVRLDLWDDNPGRNERDYWTAFNATSRALQSLERRLRELKLGAGRRQGEALRAHLEQRYREPEPEGER
jgi:hypothetical protein